MTVVALVFVVVVAVGWGLLAGVIALVERSSRRRVERGKKPRDFGVLVPVVVLVGGLVLIWALLGFVPDIAGAVTVLFLAWFVLVVTGVLD